MQEIIHKVSLTATMANCHPDNRDNSEVRGTSSQSTEFAAWCVVFRADHSGFFCDQWTQVLYAAHAGFSSSCLFMKEGSNQRQGLEKRWTQQMAHDCGGKQPHGPPGGAVKPLRLKTFLKRGCRVLRVERVKPLRCALCGT